MSAALLLTGAVLLLVPGLAHLWSQRSTAALMLAHGVLPSGWERPVTAVLTMLEIGLGAALLLSVAAGETGAQRGLGLVAAALFATLAGYAHRAWRATASTRHVPLCACGVAESPLGPWVTGRALLLALLSGVGALSTGGGAPVDRPWSEMVVLGSAAVTLSVLMLLLPAARTLPGRLPVGRAWS
ncbi:MAG: MauE/DoxX family redox-associated membrane protein [Ornithinimicrobium sp.]|uniref:MauE/DoxX family redox-associated membrane protein n=1 Tax=Ornithinimicrobium sp. TaxID=1977084 RepID=UPI00180EBEF9|nr:hypothetical protein [Actinomycetota bacterium]